jgi:hypothetical protein
LSTDFGKKMQKNQLGDTFVNTVNRTSKIFFAVIFKQTIAMGNRKRIGSQICLRTDRARNRTQIRMQIQTRVDGPQ